MNLYEYRCLRCKTLFTARSTVARCNEPATCPECGGAGRRVFSAPRRHDGVWAQPRDGDEILRTREVWE